MRNKLIIFASLAFFLLFLTSGVSATIVCKPNVVAYYPFESNSTDASGNGFNGLQNNIAFNPGVLGDAATFGGAKTSYIVLPTGILNGRPKFSVSFWIKSTGSGDGLFSVARVGYNNEFLIHSQQSLTINVQASGKDTNADLNNGIWHFIAITIDSPTKTMNVYIDGVLSRTFQITQNTIVADGIVLGQDQDSVLGGFESSQSYMGSMDELTIFDDVISSSVVSELYNNGLGTKVCSGVIIPPADTTPPLVTISSPQNKTYNFSDIPAQVSLNEPGSVNFNLKDGSGNTILSYVKMSTDDDLNFNYNALNLSDGSYLFSVNAMDLAGNINNTESARFSINTTAAGNQTVPTNQTNQTNQTMCTDSDGGLNYFVEGIIYINGVYYGEDMCSNGLVLNELFCNQYNNTDVQAYNCPFGCSDGACIQTNQTNQTVPINLEIISPTDSEVFNFTLSNGTNPLTFLYPIDLVFDYSGQVDECTYQFDSNPSQALGSCTANVVHTIYVMGNGTHELTVTASNQDETEDASLQFSLLANQESNQTNNNQTNQTNQTGLAISITSPANGQVFTINSSIPLNYMINGSAQSCWYKIDSGNNITLPGCANSTFSIADGNHAVTVFANNSLGIFSVTNNFIVNATQQGCVSNCGGGGGGGSGSSVRQIVPFQLDNESTSSTHITDYETQTPQAVTSKNATSLSFPLLMIIVLVLLILVSLLLVIYAATRR